MAYVEKSRSTFWLQVQLDLGTQTISSIPWVFLVLFLELPLFSNSTSCPQLLSTLLLVVPGQGKNFVQAFQQKFHLTGLAWITRQSLSQLWDLGDEMCRLSRPGLPQRKKGKLLTGESRAEANSSKGRDVPAKDRTFGCR